MARPVLLGVLGTPPGLCRSPQHTGHPTPTTLPPSWPHSALSVVVNGAPCPSGLSEMPRGQPASGLPSQLPLTDGQPWLTAHLLPSLHPDRACRGGGDVVVQVRWSMGSRLYSSCSLRGLPTDVVPFLPPEPLWVALCWRLLLGPVSAGVRPLSSLSAVCPALTRLRLPAVSSLFRGRSRLDTHPCS